MFFRLPSSLLIIVRIVELHTIVIIIISVMWIITYFWVESWNNAPCVFLCFIKMFPALVSITPVRTMVKAVVLTIVVNFTVLSSKGIDDNWYHNNCHQFPVYTTPAFNDTLHGVTLLVFVNHYTDVIMPTIASQITSLTVVYSTVYSDADQRKHQGSASLAFVWGIHRDRWIPRTKGQLRGKCFHLITSSWLINHC